MDDLRPRGTVSVQCSYPGCDIHFWLSPTDPRLPDGPFDCGTDHESVRLDQIEALEAMYGIRLGSCSVGKKLNGTATFHDRWWARQGVLRYAHVSQIDDPRDIPALVEWHPAGIALDQDDKPLPLDRRYPRMGGVYYDLAPDGSLREVKEVLHRCTRCSRIFTVSEKSPLAFKDSLTCAAESDWAMCWSPCAAGDQALELDAALVAQHGPDTAWTMWSGAQTDARDATDYYSAGVVLVRQIRGRTFKFALLFYDDGRVLESVPHLKFDYLPNLPLDADDHLFGAKALRACRFVQPLN